MSQSSRDDKLDEATFLRKLRDVLAPPGGSDEPHTLEQSNGLDAINERLAALNIAPSSTTATKLEAPHPEFIEHITHDERVVAVIDPEDYRQLYEAAHHIAQSATLRTDIEPFRDELMNLLERRERGTLDDKVFSLKIEGVLKAIRG